MNGKPGRKGSVLLMLMVILIVVGILAERLIPNEETITARSKEKSLNLDLSQIREAFDLKRIASPTWEPWEDNFDRNHPDAPASISKVLQALVNEGFLRSASLSDPGIMPQLWGTGAGKIYWQASGNLASNSSFYIGTDHMDAWEWNSAETDATSDNVLPNDGSIDDYPYQNKLGVLLEGKGTSLKLIR